MTLPRLNKLMSDGLGMGRDEHYQSWIRIRRRLSSPVSNLHALPTPAYARPLQLLSGLEFAAANVALWLGCHEIREQHPLWPEPHPHPSTGRHREPYGTIPFAPGLLGLAKGAGINHGVYPGTCIPYVATMDFTLEVGPKDSSRLVHWSCKPRELLDRARNRQRMWERIELERLYSRAVAASHVVIDGTDFTERLVGNLDWLRPLRSEWLNPEIRSRMEDFGNLFMLVAEDTVKKAKQYASQKLRTDEIATETLFRACAWSGIINIDAFEPVIMSLPLSLDIKARKRKLGLKLLGIDHA